MAYIFNSLISVFWRVVLRALKWDIQRWLALAYVCSHCYLSANWLHKKENPKGGGPKPDFLAFLFAHSEMKIKDRSTCRRHRN